MASTWSHTSEEIAMVERPRKDVHSYDEEFAPSEAGSDDTTLDDGVEDALLDDTSQQPDTADIIDPYVPFDNLPKEERNILTFRAVAVGLLCGGLINASNIYLGLKSGWTAGANIFGSIVGFAVLKACAKHFDQVPILGGDFGPRENNIVQTVATAAGGLSNVFVSAMPALYQLNLLSTPLQDYWRITVLTLVGAYFGILFATPLRSFFVIHAARELQMAFPSSFAAAITIRSMHMAAEGAKLARQRMMALSVAFVYAMTSRVISQFAIGILWDWHPFTWLYLVTGYQGALVPESWGWFVEWTPAFIGSGMLVGTNIAASFVAGSFLAWGVIGPILVQRGIAYGQPASTDPSWEAYISYSSLSVEYTSTDHPSPRYWLLWPGIACMVAVSFTELACQWRIFVLSGKVLYKAVSQAWLRRTKSASEKAWQVDEDGTDRNGLDPSSSNEQVKIWMWLPGLIAVFIITCIVMNLQFDMPIGEVFLAIFLAIFFSFLAIQATGATDITPLTAASKASQIVLGATTRGQGWTLAQAQRLNLIGGALASIGANQAADLTGDFRVGFLLRTSPKLQWFAQGIGSLVAGFLAPAIFVLFATAYPCILEVSPESCPFAAPSVSAWRAVAVTVTDPDFAIPQSSKWFSVIFALVGVAMVLLRQFMWTGRWEWMRGYWPNMMIVSLAFLLPSTIYGTAMLIGSSIAWIWWRKYPDSFAAFSSAIAAGLMAGEGIGGVINATLTIMGIDFDKWGTGALCPADRC